MKIPSVEYAKKLKREAERGDELAIWKVQEIVNEGFIATKKSETIAMDIIYDVYYKYVNNEKDKTLELWEEIYGDNN